MDFQDAPDIVFDNKWKKNQKDLHNIIKKNNKYVQTQVNKLLKNGYTKEEIDLFF